MIINADDYANSIHMSEIIGRCAKDGILNSTSIMINSKYLDGSLEKLQNLDIRTSLHLNIAEGAPVSETNRLSYLAKDGCFIKSFEQIVFDYYLSSKNKKEIIKSEIKEEYKNQILLYSQKLNTNEINIDSHQHYHTIPFISDILIELSKELPLRISYVRIPKEPFFIDLSKFIYVKNYLGLNIIKHLLLNLFSTQLIEKLQDNNINYNDVFVGVLFTGNVTFSSIRKALKNKNFNTLEILLHPGCLSKEEQSTWKNDKFKEFYSSENRKNEMEVLLSKDFKNYCQSLKVVKGQTNASKKFF